MSAARSPSFSRARRAAVAYPAGEDRSSSGEKVLLRAKSPMSTKENPSRWISARDCFLSRSGKEKSAQEKSIILSTSHALIVEATNLTKGVRWIKVMAKEAHQRHTSFVLETWITGIPRANIGTFDRRLRLPKEVASETVEHGIFPGTAARRLSAANTIQCALPIASRGTEAIFKRYIGGRAARRDGDPSTTQYCANRRSVQSHGRSEFKTVVGKAIACIIAIAISKGAISRNASSGHPFV